MCLIRQEFEEEMWHDLDDLSWSDELEMYEDRVTQLCWLTWLTAEHHTRKKVQSEIE